MACAQSLFRFNCIVLYCIVIAFDFNFNLDAGCCRLAPSRKADSALLVGTRPSFSLPTFRNLLPCWLLIYRMACSLNIHVYPIVQFHVSPSYLVRPVWNIYVAMYVFDGLVSF